MTIKIRKHLTTAVNLIFSLRPCTTRHKNVTIVKYKFCPETNQIIRLRTEQQFYQCLDCGKNLGLIGIYKLDPLPITGNAKGY